MNEKPEETASPEVCARWPMVAMDPWFGAVDQALAEMYAASAASELAAA